MDNALEIIKWFNNHSWALGLLHEQQTTQYSKVLTLVLSVITQWTAHYLSCAHLLDLEWAICTPILDQYETLMTCAGDKWEAREKAKAILDLIMRQFFWDQLKMWVIWHSNCNVISPYILQSEAASWTTYSCIKRHTSWSCAPWHCPLDIGEFVLHIQPCFIRPGCFWSDFAESWKALITVR